jgi:hypothetical protein
MVGTEAIDSILVKGSHDDIGEPLFMRLRKTRKPVVWGRVGPKNQWLRHGGYGSLFEPEETLYTRSPGRAFLVNVNAG